LVGRAGYRPAADPRRSAQPKRRYRRRCRRLRWGIEAIVEATDPRSRENVLRLIDPAILVRAFANDGDAAAAAEPNRDRLRRLVPDPALVRRRAAGESLRALARDYQVAHTTLARYFRRPQVARQLHTARQRARANHP